MLQPLIPSVDNKVILNEY